MTSVRTPLAYKNKRPFRKYLVPIWWQKPSSGNMYFQNIAVREGPRRFREEKREGDSKPIMCVSVVYLEKLQGYHNEHVVYMRTSFRSKPASQLLVMPSVPVLRNREDGLQKWADQLREAKKLVTRRCF